MFHKIVLLLMVFARAHAKLSYNQEQQKKEDEASAAAVLRENNVAFELSLGAYKATDGIVMNAMEYEGIIGPDTKRSITVKLDAIWSWLDDEEKEGTKRYNKCWMFCNDMKNWFSAASNMKKIQAQWKTSIDLTEDSSDAFKKWGQNSINGIENGSNTCWGGFGCKDSTEYNRIYKDMANRLQNILNDKSFTDSPTAAPTPSPSVTPSQAAPTSAPWTDVNFCKDSTYSSSCPNAVKNGWCTDPNRIRTYYVLCKKSCGLCSVCTDVKDEGSYLSCDDIKKKGYCDWLTARMYCQKTCGYCKTNSDYLEI